MGSPRKHPQIAELIRLRNVANELSSEITGLEFRWERDWLSPAEDARFEAAKAEMEQTRSALKEQLLLVREEHADALRAYYELEVMAARQEAAKNPDDWFAQNMVERWRSVAAGETDDIIFEQLLSS